MNTDGNQLPLVSVIVPCFNVEWCLPTGMESLLGQEDVSFEVIAVDDGSTDNTRSILEELSNRHANLRVVSQANAGVSAARNAGLDVSQGNWIAFFDPDDIVQNDWLASMVEACEGHHSDGCMCAYVEADASHLDSGKRRDCEFAGFFLNHDSMLNELLPGVLGRSFADVDRDNRGGIFAMDT